MSLLLNCDLGESFGHWHTGADALVMPYIDQASIACGFHAGDPLTLHDTLALAIEHQVTIGAHPSYPDLAGFGRRTMRCSAAEIHALLLYQISALDGMARSLGGRVSYVKPHGALYNDMMADANLRHTIMAAVASYHQPLPLMLQATTAAASHRREAEQAGINLLFEVFADRAYTRDGALVSRQQPGALLNHQQMLEQVQQLRDHGRVISIDGQPLALTADSLCVHGDNPTAVSGIAAIRQLLGR